MLTTFAVGLFLAIVFNDPRIRGRKVYRSLLILPYAFPGFLSALVWKGMLNPRFGFINEVLLGGADIAWLTNPWLAKLSILGVNLWLGFPYMFLVCTGALQSIPADTIEAARIDGAGAWRILRSMTLPLLMISVAPLLIASFAFNFNNFTLIYMLTGGGPNFVGTPVVVGHTDILITMVYSVAFESGNKQYGLASALSILIFIVVGVDHLRRLPPDPHARGDLRWPAPSWTASREHRRGARRRTPWAPLVARDRLAARRRHRDDRGLRPPARLRPVRLAEPGRHADRLEPAVPHDRPRELPRAVRPATTRSWFVNSIVICTVTAIGTVLMGGAAAYAFSRFRFQGRHGSLTALLIVQMFPQMLAFVAIFLLLLSIGDVFPALGLNSRLGLIAVYLGGALGREHVPHVRVLQHRAARARRGGQDRRRHARADLLDDHPAARRADPRRRRAAVVHRDVRRVPHRQGRAAAARGVHARRRPVLLGGRRAHARWGLFAAGAVLAAIPVVLLFLFLQKYIVSGLTAGSVKG